MEGGRTPHLPTEILENIFGYMEVSDIPSLAGTCKRFDDILKSSNNVWRKLFKKRFPRLLQPSCAAEIQMLLSESSHSWRTLARYRLSISLHLEATLDHMANRYLILAGLPDLAMEDFREIACTYNSPLMRDALLDEIFHPLPHRKYGLSREYYSTMLYREIQRDSVLLPLMCSFMALPPDQQKVSEAYRLLAMWKYPELGPRTLTDVDGYAARLANMVLEELRRRHPDHPVCDWTESRSEPLGDSLWTNELAKQVLDCVNYVLYQRLQLVNQEGPADSDDEELYITLEAIHRDFLRWGSGLQGIMTVVYSAVAGRLGVLVELLRMADSLMVRWQQIGNAEPLFIDVMNRGAQLNEGAALEKVRKACPEAHHQMLLEPMVPGMMLNYLAAGGHVQRCPRTEADRRAGRLLLCYTRAGCDPSRLQLPQACSLYHADRPLYTRHLCQEALNACKHRELDVDEQTVNELKHYMLSLTKRHDSTRSYCDEDEQEILYYVPLVKLHVQVPPVCSGTSRYPLPRLQAGDVVRYGGDEGPMAVVYRVQTFVVTDIDQLTLYHLLVDGERMASAVSEGELVLAQQPRPVRHLQVGRYFAEYSCGRYRPLPKLQWLNPAVPAGQIRLPAAAAAAAIGPVHTGRAAVDEHRPTAWVGDWPFLYPLEEDWITAPED